jgi:hypothetical protein
VKGTLTVDEPQGQRWDLALDLLREGPDLIALGQGLLLSRDTSGPASDGHIHIGVIAHASRERAQSEVDTAREFVQASLKRTRDSVRRFARSASHGSTSATAEQSRLRSPGLTRTGP